MSYQIIMLLLVPIQFITGILLWDVQRYSATVEFFGGVRVVDTVHVLIFIVFAAFIFIHPYLATLGRTPTAHIKAMFTGYEEIEDETPITSEGGTQHPVKEPQIDNRMTAGVGQEAPDSPGSCSVPRIRILCFFMSA